MQTTTVSVLKCYRGTLTRLHAMTSHMDTTVLPFSHMLVSTLSFSVLMKERFSIGGEHPLLPPLYPYCSSLRKGPWKMYWSEPAALRGRGVMLLYHLSLMLRKLRGRSPPHRLPAVNTEDRVCFLAASPESSSLFVLPPTRQLSG